MVIPPSSPTELPDTVNEQRGRTQLIVPAHDDHLQPGATEPPSDTSVSRASSATRVETNDDAEDVGATQPDEFAGIYYVDLVKRDVC